MSGGREDRAATAPRMDYESFVSLLVARRGKLSRRHAQLAQFCLNHPEDVAIKTIARLAEQAGAPPATFTRFAKELGFSGFPELQAVVRERVVGPGPSFSERLSGITAVDRPGAIGEDDLERPDRVFETLVEAAVHSLVRIEETLDRDGLAGFVEDLDRAEAVHVVAARGAFGIGAYAFYGLANIGKRTYLVDNLGAMRAEQIAAIGPRDALLVLTFDDYTPETVEIARLARESGRQVLAITDNELSPVVPYAKRTLYVTEARLGHFRSQVPALVLCQSLIVSLGRRPGNVD
ncbi:MurR/RpiR family transcriptional regulator [Sulfitobacter sp. D35]|uniref:MurR/RpiR family transcriptional regulator n=1 Tax=Sulfitobacter sp. D35 TaxID=3083252 RepID=UPI00296EF492|nr:MurR/RpiR family transcriptional regulator [Sulfitobacter sp. D35]MDW4499957.1 MurR/RpiR family transcriptional regulator [Sulfitobacter sp. D35]